ncbi:LANO_0G13564g1_1 [Lachancea nothofagi CBS 11611]|uniref:Conserved oligomeric Golgi complex subunit 8 n=1 Tax=Lachancea nothofagi CBS 11611 TaxID=1266666 RepID=A0A1G4KK78_9SACH|nr:LANO_0G13564g1_1 [Lachancea nothofagi CBS 11611]
MDALDVLLDGFDTSKHDPKEVEDFLITKLQCKDSYDAYFSSQPLPGSVVEDIAEIEAQISKLERELRSTLVESKEAISNVLCNEPVEPQLASMLAQIDQLWELENQEPARSTQDQYQDLFTSLEEPVEEPVDEPQEAEIDEFHAALEKLKSHASADNSSLNNNHNNLALVLTNWRSINELLELPTLTATCIKTGHYQEALLCHSHIRSLAEKFPTANIIRHIADSISHEITTTMLHGLVKMLQQNISANPMKKILMYLLSIPPFSNNPQVLIQVFMSMRHKFVCAEMDSFQITEMSNDTMRELLIKRKIEAFREHVYNALAIIKSQSEQFDLKTHESPKISIPLLQEPKKPAATNPLTLLFVETCCDALLSSLKPYKTSLSVSVCLQLVYCSFRLADCNPNYHHLFVNKISEAELFSTAELTTAMDKRRELANKYY